jgi:hypothetical protein
MSKWKIKQAPSQNEIIWENLAKNETISSIKSFFLTIALLIVSIMLITPAVLLDNLQGLENIAEKAVGGDASFLGQLVASYFAPLVIMLLNYGIIPLLVDITVSMEDHKTKSDK